MDFIKGVKTIENRVRNRIDIVDIVVARLPKKMRLLADKPYFNHRNFTIRKAVSFCLVSAVGGAILLGITYTMTEWGGQWYMYSAFIGGVVGIAVKFVLNSVFTYKE